MKRPPLPAPLDHSRAADRASSPRGWAFSPREIAALRDIIEGRRDIRRFRPDPVPADVLERVLGAAHSAPSVGLSQPWRFIVVRAPAVRAKVRGIAQAHRMLQAESFDLYVDAFLDQKVEGILEAPVGICVCCVPPANGAAVLGRATIPETDLYSTACAIENLWLTARAEGLGVGWVSFYTHEEMRHALGIPDEVIPVAWLCLGWPDERPVRPGLERAGWSSRIPLASVVMEDGWNASADGLRPGEILDETARVRTRDREDLLVKPQGSLGILEEVVERWSGMTGHPPGARLRAAHVVFAADHGHAARGTSLFAGEVTSQVAAAAARGETAIAVLARARGEEVKIVDVGIVGGTPPGCVSRPVREGTRDFTVGPALALRDVDAALGAGGKEIAGIPLPDCVVLGEIGIGNTTTASALLSAMTGLTPDATVGRGTGLDFAGRERKVAVVEAALRRAGAIEDPRRMLAELGGLELAALAGAMLAAQDRRLPVLLDGFAVTVAAMIAVRIRPTCREWLVAGHCSAEPGHAAALADLGLEPLLRLRLRLGEGSGAALSLPLIEQAGLLHAEMATFEDAGIDPAPSAR